MKRLCLSLAIMVLTSFVNVNGASAQQPTSDLDLKAVLEQMQEKLDLLTKDQERQTPKETGEVKKAGYSSWTIEQLESSLEEATKAVEEAKATLTQANLDLPIRKELARSAARQADRLRRVANRFLNADPSSAQIIKLAEEAKTQSDEASEKLTTAQEKIITAKSVYDSTKEELQEISNTLKRKLQQRKLAQQILLTAEPNFQMLKVEIPTNKGVITDNPEGSLKLIVKKPFDGKPLSLETVTLGTSFGLALRKAYQLGDVKTDRQRFSLSAFVEGKSKLSEKANQPTMNVKFEVDWKQELGFSTQFDFSHLIMGDKAQIQIGHNWKTWRLELDPKNSIQISGGSVTVGPVWPHFGASLGIKNILTYGGNLAIRKIFSIGPVIKLDYTSQTFPIKAKDFWLNVKAEFFFLGQGYLKSTSETDPRNAILNQTDNTTEFDIRATIGTRFQ